MNPYDTLGVAKEATADEIKKAYRRKSKTAHPDRNGGNEGAQQQANDAYAILSDPVRRLRYDRHGVTQNKNIEIEARQVVINLVSEALTGDAEVDPLVHVVAKTTAFINHNRAIILRSKTRHATLSKRATRISRKDKANKGDFLLSAIESGLASLKAEQQDAQRQIEISKIVLKVIEAYRYEAPEPAPRVSVTYRTNNFGGWQP